MRPLEFAEAVRAADVALTKYFALCTADLERPQTSSAAIIAIDAAWPVIFRYIPGEGTPE